MIIVGYKQSGWELKPVILNQNQSDFYIFVSITLLGKLVKKIAFKNHKSVITFIYLSFFSIKFYKIFLSTKYRKLGYLRQTDQGENQVQLSLGEISGHGPVRQGPDVPQRVGGQTAGHEEGREQRGVTEPSCLLHPRPHSLVEGVRTAGQPAGHLLHKQKSTMAQLRQLPCDTIEPL